MIDSKFILASGSPARADLLSACGLRFKQVVSGITEPAPMRGEPLRRYLTRLARLKAMSVATKFPCHMILAADTAICLSTRPVEGQALKIIGKPGSYSRAERMLKQLAGKEHVIGSGICLVVPEGHAGCGIFSDCGIARVRIRELSLNEIRQYVKRVSPLQYAGAYAVQGEGMAIISMIRGDPTVVAGLPMEKTLKLLRRTRF